jgi:hypothetical protein
MLQWLNALFENILLQLQWLKALFEWIELFLPTATAAATAVATATATAVATVIKTFASQHYATFQFQVLCESAISTFSSFASTLAVQHNRRRHVVTDEMTRASLGLVRSYSSKLRQVCGPNAIVAPSGWLTVPHNGSSDQDYTYGRS